MDSLKSLTLQKAEIYKNIFSHREFKNPMTNAIISLKYKLSLKYNTTYSEKLKENIKLLYELLDYFKSYTDDISGANMKSKKTILEIYDAVEKHLKLCDDIRENVYKTCLSSILDSEDLLLIFTDLEKTLFDDSNDDDLINSIYTAIKCINSHIQSDKLAFANIKQEILLCSINESLQNVVCRTKDNMKMYVD